MNDALGRGKVMARVAVVGLDGLDPDMVGMVPALQGLRVYRLDSLIPLTYPSWSTIMTGVNPGKHGLLDFFHFEREPGGGWRPRLLTALDLDYPRVHEALRLSPLRGRVRYAVVNPLPSAPLIPVPPAEGFVASMDFFAPRMLFNDERLASRYYDLEEYEALREEFARTHGCEGTLKVYRGILRAHREALKAMLADYDLVWLNVNVPDAFLHRCPRALKDRGLLRELLSLEEGLVREALEGADTVVVLSDHGFGVYKGKVRVNALLHREGLAVRGRSLEIGGSGGSAVEDQVTIGAGLARLGFRLARGRLRPLVRGAFLAASRIVKAVTGKRLVYRVPADVDPVRSKAFMPAGTTVETPRYIVLLNDKSVAGRVVEVLEAAGLEAHYAPDILSGPHTPDYIVHVYGRVRHPVAGTVYDDPIVEEEVAQHRRYGVIALRGGGAFQEPEGSVLPSHIAAPLVLCSLGAPLDPYMDSYEAAARHCNAPTGRASYRGRWLAFKRIAARRAR